MADVTLSFEEIGPKSGRPVVLLHGFPLSRRMWSTQTERAKTAGVRFILPDLRGHGQSPVVDEASTMERCAADVEELVDELGLDRFVLGGFSLGGYVALEFARRHASRLDGLALIDTRAEPDSDEARRKRQETAEAVRREGMKILEKAMMPKLLTEATRTRRSDLTESVRAMILATPPEGAARALEGMAQRRDQRPTLPGLNMPALVVVGEHDELTPPAASRVMDEALPESTLHVLPEAAHLSPLEAAPRFNEAFFAWLASLLGGDEANGAGGASSSGSRSRFATSR